MTTRVAIFRIRDESDANTVLLHLTPHVIELLAPVRASALVSPAHTDIELEGSEFGPALVLGDDIGYTAFGALNDVDTAEALVDSIADDGGLVLDLPESFEAFAARVGRSTALLTQRRPPYVTFSANRAGLTPTVCQPSSSGFSLDLEGDRISWDDLIGVLGVGDHAVRKAELIGRIIDASREAYENDGIGEVLRGIGARLDHIEDLALLERIAPASDDED